MDNGTKFETVEGAEGLAGSRKDQSRLITQYQSICVALALIAMSFASSMIIIALLEKHGAFEKCLERNPAKECAYLR